ncbi:response regulator [Variovorax sp. VNK109]|jgi:two-component system chemotaxis response regulator CheY|uniref:response regulator n=1 Tax=Variovorax sp. VNK109 TaxID=3400919 RepID=UPI003BFB51BE
MSKTVLTVDDSASIRQMVAMTLRMGGYEVVEAADGVEGLTKAREHQVDLIITDQNMPHMDGLTLTRELRSTERYGRSPILMLTTESSQAMKDAGRAAGLTGWMVKPFDPSTLLNVVGRVLA